MKDGRLFLGEKLREAREYLDLSQDDAAKVLGIPRTAISLMETGQRKVEVLELKQLAKLYERPLAFFTGESEGDNAVPESVNHLARTASTLSEKDREELMQFAKFLQAKGKK